MMPLMQGQLPFQTYYQEQWQKGQTLRLIDVVLLGPFMIATSKQLLKKDRQLMWWTGWLVIIFNGLNYLRNMGGYPA